MKLWQRIMTFALLALLVIPLTGNAATATTPKITFFDGKIALKSDGTLWWLDEGSELPRRLVQVSGAVSAVSGRNLGGWTVYYLKADGTVWQCTSETGSKPEQVKGLTGIAALDASADDYVVDKAYYALGKDGTVWVWGKNNAGQFGNGAVQTKESLAPVQVPGLKNVVKLSGSRYNAIALTKDGSVWTWGGLKPDKTDWSQPANFKTKPEKVAGLTGVVDVEAGDLRYYALTSKGTAYAWGDNYYGQLGTGADRRTVTAKPERVVKLNDIVQISAGSRHTLFLLKDGTVWGTGANTLGQLGMTQVSYGSTNIPVRDMEFIYNAIRVCANDYQSLIIARDGLVYQTGKSKLSQFYIVPNVMFYPLIFRINGEEQAETATVYNASPSRTYVPVSAIARVKESKTNWDGDSKTAAVEGAFTLSAKVGDRQITFNGTDYPVEGQVMLINGRVMLPLSLISQLFNGSASWDPSHGAVELHL